MNGWMDGWMHERMHARRMDVDAHFGHPDISFPEDKCRIEDIGHYFERARGTTGGFWSQVSMERRNRTSTVPRFCLGKTEV